MKRRYEERISTISQSLEQLVVLKELLNRPELDDNDYQLLLIVLNLKALKNPREIVEIQKELVILGKRFDVPISKENIESFNKKFTT